LNKRYWQKTWCHWCQAPIESCIMAIAKACNNTRAAVMFFNVNKTKQVHPCARVFPCKNYHWLMRTLIQMFGEYLWCWLLIDFCVSQSCKKPKPSACMYQVLQWNKWKETKYVSQNQLYKKRKRQCHTKQTQAELWGWLTITNCVNAPWWVINCSLIIQICVEYKQMRALSVKEKS